MENNKVITDNLKFRDADFDDYCGTVEQLSEFLQYRAFYHGDYCHYSTLENIYNIMKNKEFWLTPSMNSNDTNDRNKGIYNLCFTSGTSENLPLWYLYGQGARIEFKKEIFQNLFNKQHCKVDNSTQKKVGKDIELKLTLNKNDTVKQNYVTIPNEYIKISDILYLADNEKNTARFKYNGKNKFNVDIDIKNEYLDKF